MKTRNNPGLNLHDCRSVPQASACVVVAWLVATCFLAGCLGKPDRANIELRRKNQSLEAQIAELNRLRQADAATIRALQEHQGPLPALPQDRLEKLFTTHGLQLSRLTTADQHGIRVYIVPTDQMGDQLKAAGSFVIEVFDLSRQTDNLIGQWQFSTEQSRLCWHGSGLLYAYVFVCPWQQTLPPLQGQITLKVTFCDELTGRRFTVQKALDVQYAS